MRLEEHLAHPVILAVRQLVRREIASLTRKLLALARDNDVSRRLMTVPGIGPINALAFCAAIDDPTRRSGSAVGYRPECVPTIGRG